MWVKPAGVSQIPVAIYAFLLALKQELPPWRAPPSTMTSEYILPEQLNTKDPETQSQEVCVLNRGKTIARL